MKRPKTNRLKKLRFTELSLVDRPANPFSIAVITKRAPAPVSFQEVMHVLKKEAS
jgi:hypothetical protein